MKMTRLRLSLGLAGLGLAVTALSGCQTQVTGTGMTLPSPHYLEHPPQYIPPSPPFPLSRELASQEAVNNAPGGPIGPLPVAVPPGGPLPVAPRPAGPPAVPLPAGPAGPGVPGPGGVPGVPPGGAR